MRILDCEKVLLVGACMMAALGAWGQIPSGVKQPTGRIDVAVTYDALQANLVATNNFWMQGGSLQVHGQFWRGWGAVADLEELHTANMYGTGVGLDMVTATFGPRYTWTPAHGRYAAFGQILAGDANGFNSVFPSATGANSTANSLALRVGGGVNLPLNRRLALRVFEANWLRTQMPNGTTNVQNNLRMGAGIVFRF